MLNIVSVALSCVALILSATTLWLTLLRRGRLAMTKPTIVFLGFDFDPRLTPKVFLRTLLYSTSPKGKVIEGMYAKLSCGESERFFTFWGMGKQISLRRGADYMLGKPAWPQTIILSCLPVRELMSFYRADTGSRFSHA